MDYSKKTKKELIDVDKLEVKYLKLNEAMTIETEIDNQEMERLKGELKECQEKKTNQGKTINALMESIDDYTQRIINYRFRIGRLESALADYVIGEKDGE